MFSKTLGRLVNAAMPRSRPFQVVRSWPTQGVGPVPCCLGSKPFWNRFGTFLESFQLRFRTSLEPFSSRSGILGLSEWVLNGSRTVLKRH